MMDSDREERLAFIRHGVNAESESDDSSDGKSDFDDEHEFHKPPPMSVNEKECDIVKVEAFETVFYKRNGIQKLQSKLYTNYNKPKCTSNRIKKENKRQKRITKNSENSQKCNNNNNKPTDSTKCIDSNNKIKEPYKHLPHHKSYLNR